MDENASYETEDEKSHCSDNESGVRYRVPLPCLEYKIYHLLCVCVSSANQQMGVSWNRGTPKSSILVGLSLYKPTIWGYPHDYGNPQIT